jgi:pectin methylesterase-like acyl-CoA thioesterase
MNLIKLFLLAIFIAFAFLLTGCSTAVPVTVKFPDVPAMILEKCPQLKAIDNDTVSIVDYTKTVTINYTTYYECAVKTDTWIEWYQIQKKIFEQIKD